MMLPDRCMDWKWWKALDSFFYDLDGSDNHQHTRFERFLIRYHLGWLVPK